MQMSEQMSTSDDIVRAKQIKELEPIQVAWNQWTRTKSVSLLHIYVACLIF
jgi:hypothetical protein